MKLRSIISAAALGAMVAATAADTPVRRPLMEEYTALWCGYCTRGFAMMEYMNEKYGDDFVCVAIHSDDAMAVLKSRSFASTVTGYPLAYLDRYRSLDPYFGTSNGESTFETDWLKRCEVPTTVDVNVAAARDEEDPTIINISTTVTTTETLTDTHKIAYYLTSNGISNPLWVQTNYYSGVNATGALPQMIEMCLAPYYIDNLVFNDVVVANSLTKGLTNSLPDTLEPDTDYTHTYTFKTADKKSLEGYDLITGASSLTVVAIVVNSKTGEVANCAKTTVADAAGISGVAADGVTAVAKEYYDLQGRAIAPADAHGLTIVRTIMSDGSCAVEKRVIK